MDSGKLFYDNYNLLLQLLLLPTLHTPHCTLHLHTPHFLSYARNICPYNLFYVSGIIAKDHVTNYVVSLTGRAWIKGTNMLHSLLLSSPLRL